MGSMFPNGTGSRAIVDDDSAGAFRNAPQHGAGKEARILRGERAISPETVSFFVCKIAIVINKFADVRAFSKRTQIEMVQQRVMEDYNTRLADCVLIHGRVERIVSYVIDGRITYFGCNFHVAVFP